MKTIRRHWLKLCSVAAFLAASIVILTTIAWESVADEVPLPVMTITVTNTNQLFIQITNGVSFANYELYRRTIFDPVFPFTLNVIGTQGQTNFTVDMGIESIGFFQTAIGSDWDQDGIQNFQDGDPASTNVGILSITIDSPANGSTFN